MISLGPVQDTLNSLPKPSSDAAFLNAALDPNNGPMFINPIGDSMSYINSLGLDTHAADLAELPGGAALAAQCSDVSKHAQGVTAMSNQMFSSTMATKQELPTKLLEMSDLPTADLAKLQDFPIPSVTDIMSTAATEQANNAELGTTGKDPCLPMQKAMEGTMKDSGALNSMTTQLSNSGTGKAMKSAVTAAKTAYAALQNATPETQAGLQAAFNSAMTHASNVVNSAVNTISGGLTKMGNSLLGSMNTTRQSTEKAMNIATARMAKNMVSNNPCLKQVLNPGSNVLEFNTAFVISNTGDALETSAAYLLEDANVAFTTTLSSLGYETWQHSTDATSISSTKTERNISLTYTLDVDKLNKADLGLDHTLSVITITVNNPATGNKSWVKVTTMFQAINTDNPSSLSAATVSTSIHLETGDPVWSVAKKKGLLSPAMQAMTEPPPPVKEDFVPPATNPVVVQTPTQAQQAAVKATTPPPAPPTVEESTTVVAPEKITATDTTSFTKRLAMSRTRTKTDYAWKQVTRTTIESLTGRGNLSSHVDQTSEGAVINLNYELDAGSISQYIAEYKSKNLSAPTTLYYECDIIHYWDKWGKNMMNIVVYFYLVYYPETGQVSITSRQKSGQQEDVLTWDTVEFIDA